MYVIKSVNSLYFSNVGPQKLLYVQCFFPFSLPNKKVLLLYMRVPSSKELTHPNEDNSIKD